MVETIGMNHLGLSVANLDETVSIFVDVLGWAEEGRDESYPRSAVSDGKMRLTLWQMDHSNPIVEFDRRANIGLHHLAISVESESQLNLLADRIKSHPGTSIEFLPELLGTGPRKHMMFYEPGGIRLELIWSGE